MRFAQLQNVYITEHKKSILLVLNLVVEVPGKPVREKVGSDVGRCAQLHGEPVFLTLLVAPNVVGQVAHLGAPYEPVAFNHSVGQQEDMKNFMINYNMNTIGVNF
jgi:hypothetical protein